MPTIKSDEDAEESQFVLGLLESVERNSTQSQRGMAAEFGVALGLVNAYLKRCIRKGWVKVKTVPARRYSYFLTPQGLAEKSRLTLAYLNRSMIFFREARKDCSETLFLAKQQGWSRAVVLGASDLAEIAAICGLECGITIVAVVDPALPRGQFLGVPVVACIADVTAPFDGAIVTELVSPHAVYTQAKETLGADRVLAPRLLGIPAGRHTDRLSA